MRKILIVGGGYVGFYTAWRLERALRRDEAQITLVEPRPYMTYQPFLPEVLAGSIEARHAAVSLRRHLRRTRIVTGRAISIDHDRKTVTVATPDRPPFDESYDIVVVTAGAVTRTFPLPGVAEQAIGLKHVEEAVAIRDRLLTSFDRASTLPAGPLRSRLLTVTFVGGGFSGVEGFGELLSMADDLLERYPELPRSEMAFHLIEASPRLMPEVSARTATWVAKELETRGAHLHLSTQLTSAVDGNVVLSDGQEFGSGLIVWAAGNAPNPLVAKHTDLPVNERGLLVVRTDLRVGTADAAVVDAWGAGDGAAVPDLASTTGSALTVPNAQHAVRQGKHLAANIVASLRGLPTREYRHHSLGVVATLGWGQGIFESGPVVVKGFPAWVMHRGYHVLAVPTWERKLRVLADWLPALAFGRDIVSMQLVQRPRAAFLEDGTVTVERPNERHGSWN